MNRKQKIDLLKGLSEGKQLTVNSRIWIVRNGIYNSKTLKLSQADWQNHILAKPLIENVVIKIVRE